MADYQKVEIVKDESQAFTEDDIQKVEALEQPQEQEAEESGEEERPEWLPDKFGSPEELAKAYTELQSNFTKQRQQGEDADDVEQAPEGAGFNFDQYSQEFSQSGELSDESIAAIEAQGIPRQMIDGYMAGQQAIMDAQFNSIYSEVGGEESYNNMVEWAGDNLSEGEQSAFNKAVMDGSQDDMMFAIRGLALRYQQQEGTAKPLVQGSTSSAQASSGFKSLAELTSAMKDPRYNKDPAYRQQIESRLSVSNIL